MNILKYYKYDILSFIVMIVLLAISFCFVARGQTYYYSGNCANGSCYSQIQTATEPVEQAIKPEPEQKKDDAEIKRKEREETHSLISDSIDKAMEKVGQDLVKKADLIMIETKTDLFEYLKSISGKVALFTAGFFSMLFYFGYLIGKLFSKLFVKKEE